MSEKNDTSAAAPAPDATASASGGHGFGTLPVFLAGISTILGAIMFLRFGYAVGHVGLLGALAIILLGHLVTIPTALALAEIATNRKVEGGGEYFIISRSFGRTIGSVIGISLYASQAISVAFYLIALAEAFRPIGGQIAQLIGMKVFDPRMISLPATALLLVLMLTKGADLGVKALYVVVATLVASLVVFFFGNPVSGFEPGSTDLTATTTNAQGFFLVFAICFPAFTGMTAGVGLSGDLANPRRSIPAGTLLATGIGMLVYVAIVFKLWASAPSDQLATNDLIMKDIALWGPMILIGLGAATLSSAIGSILVAPRTLQALAADGSFPSGGLNRWVAKGVGANNEPRNATLITGAFALGIVFLGDVNFVARLISMFFMVTYGSLCAISFLEHFAARPSYRPSFRSRWYLSLFGALMCFAMMFAMDPLYAAFSLGVLGLLYWLMSSSRHEEESDLAAMFRGVLTQLTRYLQIKLQRKAEETDTTEWRPSVIMVSERTFDRRVPLEFMRWLCHRYGFGTYLHFIKGGLKRDTYLESLDIKERMLKLARIQHSTVYMDTIVSPSMTSALAQSLQVPGISGLPNNTALFEFSDHDDPEQITEIVDSCLFASHTQMSLLVLRHGDLQFGEHQTIHIWLTWNDRRNANLMILLGYILLGHPDWSGGEVTVFAAVPSKEIAEQRRHFADLMGKGRIPISRKNVNFLPVDDLASYRRAVEERSADADLTIAGFDLKSLLEKREGVFENHPQLPAILFVHAAEEIGIE